MSGYLLEFEGKLCPFFTHSVDALKDVTVLQSLSESQKYILKEVHPP